MTTIYRVDIKEYENSYEIPLRVLRRVGIRFLKNDGEFARKCWTILAWYEVISTTLAAFMELGYIVKVASGGSFEATVGIFKMVPCLGFVVLSITKGYRMIRYRPVFETLIKELAHMWPAGDISEQECNVVQGSLKKLKIVVEGYYWCTNALMAFYLVRPFIAIFKRTLGYDEPLVLPFYYLVPFDPYARGYYEFMLLDQTWHAAIVVWCVYAGDIFYCVFLSHITVNLDLLSIRIRTLIYVPTDKQLIKEYPLGTITSTRSKTMLMTFQQKEEYFVKELKSIVKRHSDIIRLSETVEQLFSFALLVNFCNSSVIICFSGFYCILVEEWNELVYKVFLLTALAQTWLFCWYGNRLCESVSLFWDPPSSLITGSAYFTAVQLSRGVSEALYSCGWYTCSKKIMCPLLIMIQRAQKSIRVTTYGFSTVSLGTFTTVLKTSWSYFTLLLHFYKR